MFIAARSLDDALRKVLARLIASRTKVVATKGPNVELTGVLIKIRNPRARLSRTETKGTIYSCLGELLWYLSGSNKLSFISYYLPRYKEFSDDEDTIFGGYGPRLFGMRGIDQVDRAIRLLKSKPETRKAVIQLFDAEDLVEDHKDIPCTCTLQFLLRGKKLHMLTNMRSNDAFVGLPHDVFAFTMLQEIMARSVGAEIGQYVHSVGSLHLYETNRAAAKTYLKEGWQSSAPMPPMPMGDPWPSLKKLQDIARMLRHQKEVDLKTVDLDHYWLDLARILHIFASSGKGRVIERIKRRIHSDVYKIYIDKRKTMNPPAYEAPRQLDLLLD